jgi:hypothetical protein
MKLALQVKTTGEVERLDLAPDSLATLQAGVGGYIEAIDLAKDLTLWCNEEGKIIELPHNPFAQFIWDMARGVHTDYIVGDIVLTGGTDKDGETLGLSEEQVEIVKQTIDKVRQIVEPRATILEWA